jgi:hypothetical protein
VTRPATVEIDHLRYLADRRYRRETHLMFRRLARKRGQVSCLDVVHECDDACCAFEPWPQTARRIHKALSDGGLPVLWASAV